MSSQSCGGEGEGRAYVLCGERGGWCLSVHEGWEGGTYYVRVGEQEIATNVTGVNLTSADGLLPGTQYTIQVSTCHACYMYI